MLESSLLRHLLALGRSLGAHSQVLCDTTEQCSTLTRISFTFDDDMPFCTCDLLESIHTGDTILANSTAIIPAAAADPCTSPPPSLALSAITTTAVDNDEYPHSAFDSAFDSLDITGTQATIVNRTVPYPPTPHSAVRAFASAVLDLPPAHEVNYDHSWYVITIGKEVGIFCRWNNAAPHVIGVPVISHHR